MAYIRQRSGKYQAIVKKDGCRFSKTFTTEKEAQLWALQTEMDDNIKGDTPHEEQSPTMRIVLEKYIEEVVPHTANPQSEASYNTFLSNQSWCDIPLDELDVETLSRWRDMRYRTCQPKTVKSNFMAYRTAINYWYGKFDLESPNKVFRQVKLRNASERFVPRLSDDEITHIKSFMPQKLAGQFLPLLIDFAVETGMRRGEMLKLEWKMVDLQRKWLNLAGHITKTGKPRRIPLTIKCEDAIVTFKQLDDERKATHRRGSFFSTDAGRDRVFTVGTTQLREVWEKTKNAAGYSHLHWHDLRHEAISRLFEKGMTMIEVQSISGHDTIEELTRYSHANDTSVFEKMRG